MAPPGRGPAWLTFSLFLSWYPYSGAHAIRRARLFRAQTRLAPRPTSKVAARWIFKLRLQNSVCMNPTSPALTSALQTRQIAAICSTTRRRKRPLLIATTIGPRRSPTAIHHGWSHFSAQIRVFTISSLVRGRIRKTRNKGTLMNPNRRKAQIRPRQRLLRD